VQKAFNKAVNLHGLHSGVKLFIIMLMSEEYYLTQRRMCEHSILWYETR